MDSQGLNQGILPHTLTEQPLTRGAKPADLWKLKGTFTGRDRRGSTLTFDLRKTSPIRGEVVWTL